MRKKYDIRNIPLLAVVPFPTGQFANLGNLNFQDFISYGINILLVLSAVLFFFMLVTGGIKYMLSTGDKSKRDSAVGGITNAFIGLTIVLSTWAVLTIVGEFFGVNMMTFQLP